MNNSPHDNFTETPLDEREAVDHLLLEPPLALLDAHLDELATRDRAAMPAALGDRTISAAVAASWAGLRLSGTVVQPANVRQARFLTPIRAAAAVAIVTGLLAATLSLKSGPSANGTGPSIANATSSEHADLDAMFALVDSSDDDLSFKLDALLADAARLSANVAMTLDADISTDEESL